jgi:hypothetical protein
MFLMPMAAMSHVFELVTPFISLSTVLAVFFDGDAEIVFRFVNISLASCFRTGGQGRTDQADQRQQGYAKNPDGTSHIAFSF